MRGALLYYQSSWSTRECGGHERLDQVNGGKEEVTRRMGTHERRTSSRLRGYIMHAIQQNIKRGIDNEGGQLHSRVS